jgi:GH15 family glucan-1,4-alpha-glucosidase
MKQLRPKNCLCDARTSLQPKLGRFCVLAFSRRRLLRGSAHVDASFSPRFLFRAFDGRRNCEKRCGQSRKNLVHRYRRRGRFENDGYMRVSDDLPANAWFICTLWLADYYIARAAAKTDLQKALKILTWTTKRAQPSGVLAEQVHPTTGEPISVAPLTWSHSTFVATVMNYLQKLSKVG